MSEPGQKKMFFLEKGKVNTLHALSLLKKLTGLTYKDLLVNIPALQNKEITFRLQPASRIYGRKSIDLDRDRDMFNDLIILTVFGSNLEGDKKSDISKMDTAYTVYCETKEIRGFVDFFRLDESLRGWLNGMF